MQNLQLQDYKDGYRFRLKCRTCKHERYEDPADLLQHPHTHAHMYIEELEMMLTCQACHHTHNQITPLPIRPKHHFTGGLA